jgi:hypothetical protein
MQLEIDALKARPGQSQNSAAAASFRPAHPRLSGECEIQRTRHAPAIGTASL